VRSGILDKDGRDTGIDPFMAFISHTCWMWELWAIARTVLSGKCTLAGIQMLFRAAGA